MQGVWTEEESLGNTERALRKLFERKARNYHSTTRKQKNSILSCAWVGCDARGDVKRTVCRFISHSNMINATKGPSISDRTRLRLHETSRDARREAAVSHKSKPSTGERKSSRCLGLTSSHKAFVYDPISDSSSPAARKLFADDNKCSSRAAAMIQSRGKLMPKRFLLSSTQ